MRYMRLIHTVESSPALSVACGLLSCSFGVWETAFCCVLWACAVPAPHTHTHSLTPSRPARPSLVCHFRHKRARGASPTQPSGACRVGIPPPEGAGGSGRAAPAPADRTYHPDGHDPLRAPARAPAPVRKHSRACALLCFCSSRALSRLARFNESWRCDAPLVQRHAIRAPLQSADFLLHRSQLLVLVRELVCPAGGASCDGSHPAISSSRAWRAPPPPPHAHRCSRHRRPGPRSRRPSRRRPSTRPRPSWRPPARPWPSPTTASSRAQRPGYPRTRGPPEGSHGERVGGACLERACLGSVCYCRVVGSIHPAPRGGQASEYSGGCRGRQ